MKMRKFIKHYIIAFLLLSNTGIWAKDKTSLASQDCNTLLAQIMKNSDFDYPGKDYYVRIEDTTGGTVIIKAYVRNNLSDNPKKPQMVESVVSWLIIQPQRDGIYQSLNALDPEEPDFKKLKIDKKAFDTLVKCIDKK
ncbi:hypothetical protein HX017_15610 [Myroides marinus]|uniref:Uncharacterized protein n=1 Tax=Myroides marinus TaxID=703342 RepID=A0A1H6WTR5_9FLAO|nr:hypothetical protein [Myroides marinus]MDM1348339.1 hypothetical protein [Myroides marinus]MDM1351830.1 hypothetical protein [Myroides marinus]MDM1355441.1 hypothetical protein [Myroides marinus]MDM1359058.1 hypothetical protein [Myroides marinus]MDM1360467.1 hypothetical protein [Myroides marinus]